MSKKSAGARPARGERAPVAARAVAAPLPDLIEPELATLVETPPPGEDWAHEIKLDGYRILARVDHGQVSLYSRRGNDWTSRMPGLVSAVGALPVETAFVDGELVSLDRGGKSDFQSLQDALARGPAGPATNLAYYAFDLPYLDGYDLRDASLADRKTLLGQVVAPLRSGGTVRLSEHVVGRGQAVFAEAARMGLEGIVSKQLAAPYRSGRGHSWLKAKCMQRQELVVVGFTHPKGSRSHLGALLLATRGRHGYVYRGRVGTGFTEAALRMLHDRLILSRVEHASVVNPPSGAEAGEVRWVKPTLVVEVRFADLTQDGLLRHATFLGLREDKDPSEVTLEIDPPAT